MCECKTICDSCSRLWCRSFLVLLKCLHKYTHERITRTSTINRYTHTNIYKISNNNKIRISICQMGEEEKFETNSPTNSFTINRKKKHRQIIIGRDSTYEKFPWHFNSAYKNCMKSHQSDFRDILTKKTHNRGAVRAISYYISYEKRYLCKQNHP